jgi:hypothetical protein
MHHFFSQLEALQKGQPAVETGFLALAVLPSGKIIGSTASFPQPEP